MPKSMEAILQGMQKKTEILPMETAMQSMELPPVMAQMFSLNHMADDIEIRVQREVP